MKSFFYKIFNLYPGEGKKTLTCALLAFIWSLASYCGVTLSDGMFLEHTGAKSLPIAYLLTALALFCIAFFFLRTFHRFNAYKIYLAVLLTGSFGYGFFFFHDSVNDQTFPFWLSFKVFCNILTVILTTSFWFFIDQYYNLQNAKRLFSLFNATIFLGNACGGFLLALCLNQIGMKGLLLIIFLLLVLTGVLVKLIASKIPILQDDSSEEHTACERQSLKTFWKNVISSRFTLFLMGTYLMIQILNIVTEYTYMQSFDRFFDNQPIQIEENQLTTFLGVCTAWIAVANMLFGFFFYSRAVNRFGINNLVGISTFLFLTLFVGWTFTSALIVAILGLIIVEGISYTLDENNSNLLLNAVPPKLKNRTRIAIDSFCEPFGMFLCALAFIFLDFSSHSLGLILALISVFFVLIIRKEYAKALLNNLLENAIHFERKSHEWLSRLSLREKKLAKVRLFTTVRQLDEPSQILAYEALLKFHDPKIIPLLLNQLQRLSVRGKIKVIQLLALSPFSREPQVLDRLSTWLKQKSSSTLKGAIHFYLAKLGLLPLEKALADLTNEDLTLRGAAILALKKIDSPAPLLIREALSCANNQVDQLLSSTEEDELCMGISILSMQQNPGLIERLLTFLKSPSKKVIRQTMLAISQSTDKTSIRYAPWILPYLTSSDPECRAACLHSLGKIDDSTLIQPIILASLHFRQSERRLAENILIRMGLKSVPTLLALTKNREIHYRCRSLAGRALGHLALPQLRANLLEIITTEIDRAYFYFYHAISVQENHVDEALNILHHTLLTRFESIIDFIIQLLGVAGSIEDSDLLNKSLKSSNPKTRAQAIEAVEKTCEGRIFRLLKPLIDDRPQSEKLKSYLKRAQPLLTLEELLSFLQHSPFLVDQIIALTLKARLNLPNWRASLRKRMENADEVFHKFAYELLESTTQS